jgi:hypothetical protein
LIKSERELTTDIKMNKRNHQTVFPTSPTQEKPPPLSPAKTHVVVEAYEIYERETELVLPCYIMMLDLYLKQVQF